MSLRSTRCGMVQPLRGTVSSLHNFRRRYQQTDYRAAHVPQSGRGSGRGVDPSKNNFTFEIEDVSFQMIHGELSTIKGGSETVHDNWTRSGLDLYAARPATASMRSAIVSFLITPPQSHSG